MAEAELPTDPTVTKLASPVKSGHKRTKSIGDAGVFQSMGIPAKDPKAAVPDDEDEGAYVPGTDAASLAVWQSLQTFGKDKESAYKVVVADGRVTVKRKLTLKLAKAKEAEAQLGRPPVVPRARNSQGERATTLAFADEMALVAPSSPAFGFVAGRSSKWKLTAPARVSAVDGRPYAPFEHVRMASAARDLLHGLLLPRGAAHALLDDGFSPA